MKDPNLIDLADHDRGAHWLQPSQSDPSGRRRRIKAQVSRLIRRALALAGALAAPEAS